ncbi:hypothetical protein VNN36_12225 (plasmid) [Lactococcus garvieae]|uniref:hypothetical protein n=1 Tax=Lactococcus garvieae TaxID=1363 RepID=UPI0030D2480E
MVKNQIYFSGDEFKDISKKGKDRHWKERKRKNVKLAGAFKKLDYDKKFVGNINSCAEYLNFKRAVDGTLRLYQMYTGSVAKFEK